jgi:hypothetical protein
MRNTPNKNEKGDYVFPASVTIGEQVKLKIPMSGIENDNVYIRVISFTNSKVRFSVYLEDAKTTLHNIDSIWIEKLENPNFIDFDNDNYS